MTSVRVTVDGTSPSSDDQNRAIIKGWFAQTQSPAIVVGLPPTDTGIFLARLRYDDGHETVLEAPQIDGGVYDMTERPFIPEDDARWFDPEMLSRALMLEIAYERGNPAAITERYIAALASAGVQFEAPVGLVDGYCGKDDQSYVVGAVRVSGTRMAIIIRELDTSNARVGCRRAWDPWDDNFLHNIEAGGANTVRV